MTEDKDEFLKGQIASDFDYYRIRDEIAGLAVTEEGRDLLLKREPVSDISVINELKTLGREWNTYLNSSHPQAINGFPPVKEYFDILNVEGACLMQDQIFALGLFSTYAQKAKTLIESAKEDLEIPLLSQKAQEMPDVSEVAKEIFSVLEPTGEVKDLPQLRAIRSKILSLKKEIENSIRRYTSDNTLNSVLQSNVPAYRADRELLAVRADKRNAIKGIVHEVSSSGQTLYIEPEEIVKANNELVEEEFHLMQEMNKIFKDLTSRLAEYKEALENSHSILIYLDTAYAAAKWQNETNGVFAEYCDMTKEPPAIFSARHPLLGKKAVPVTISFMGGKNVLIITGPNTGGKTVTLKTIALFSLLNQAGFSVPAMEGTRLPVFGSVFADIGDEQSIDNSLSTFSSRMKNLSMALTHADEKSLVLLDELGSGTDPLEGSAISMAALDSLLEKNSFVIVTTHHGILKNYGYTNPKCVNASVEFNSETLSPTYRLMMGIPGESHGIEIASRSGLPQDVVAKAKNYIATEQADVSTLIRGLTSKHEELDNLIAEQRQKEYELDNKQIKIHNRENKLAEKEIELKEIEHTQSTRFLRDSRSQLENLVRVLREGEITKEKIRTMKNFVAELSQEIDSQTDNIEALKENLEKEKEALEKEQEIITQNGMRLSRSKSGQSKSSKKTKQKMKNAEALKNAKPLELENPAPAKAAKHISREELFKEGGEVFAGSERRKGILIKKVKDGIWQVQFGSMKMNVPQRQLIPAEPLPEHKSTPSVVYVTESSADKSEAPKFELRLLGMRFEEAMKALEKQLDLCAIHNFKNFSVVHGKGTGILQQGVHDYLSHYPGVKNFYFARPEEGGSGKTYVELM